MIRILALLAALFALAAPSSAQAQAPVVVYCYTGLSGTNSLLPCSTTYPLAVSASVSASISGFPTVQSTGTPISVTTGGVTGTLPTGAVVVASNVGATNAAYCKLGGSATTSDQYIAPGSWFAFTVGANTQLTCITSTSTTTVNMVGGSGLPTGAGGGGGGSGGAVTIASSGVASGAYASGSIASGAYASGAFASGAIGSGAIASGAVASGAVASGAFASGSIASGAIVSGADVTEGTTADTTVYAGSGGCTVVACLKGLYAGIASSIPAGANAIGTIIPYARTYNTIAASQTTQALTGGGGGATGDYLSHCVIQPTTTAAGTVIIYDNSTAIFTFTTGTLSNLVPFTIPVGAVSVSGAWKVTTGANETATCVGKFT